MVWNLEASNAEAAQYHRVHADRADGGGLHLGSAGRDRDSEPAGLCAAREDERSRSEPEHALRFRLALVPGGTRDARRDCDRGHGLRCGADAAQPPGFLRPSSNSSSGRGPFAARLHHPRLRLLRLRITSIGNPGAITCFSGARPNNLVYTFFAHGDLDGEERRARSSSPSARARRTSCTRAGSTSRTKSSEVGARSVGALGYFRGGTDDMRARESLVRTKRPSRRISL